MFNIVPNYNELAMRQMKRGSIYTIEPLYSLRRRAILSQFSKVCPRCGAILKIDARGCDNCLLQFKKVGEDDKDRCKK